MVNHVCASFRPSLHPFLLYFCPRSFQSPFPLVPAASNPPPFLPRSTSTLLFTAIICSVFIVFPALIDYVWLPLFLCQRLRLQTNGCVCEQRARTPIVHSTANVPLQLPLFDFIGLCVSVCVRRSGRACMQISQTHTSWCVVNRL